MEIVKLNYFGWVIAVFLLASCETNDDPEPAPVLETLGFIGTLPDGSEFGSTNTKSATGLGVSGINNVYSGRYIASLRNFESGWSLGLESPIVTFNEEWPRNLGEGDGVELKAKFKKAYSFDLLVEKLKSEEKKCNADPSYTAFDNFRITLTQQDEYFTYVNDINDRIKPDKVKILLVELGFEQNLDGQDVRKIEVVVEIELGLRTADGGVPQSGLLKGIARFKYREDIYSGEFEE